MHSSVCVSSVIPLVFILIPPVHPSTANVVEKHKTCCRCCCCSFLLPFTCNHPLEEDCVSSSPTLISLSLHPRRISLLLLLLLFWSHFLGLILPLNALIAASISTRTSYLLSTGNCCFPRDIFGSKTAKPPPPSPDDANTHTQYSTHTHTLSNTVPVLLGLRPHWACAFEVLLRGSPTTPKGPFVVSYWAPAAHCYPRGHLIRPLNV